MTEKTTATRLTKTARSERRHAILIELEGIAFQGHRVFYEAVDGVLKQKGIHVTPHEFVRYCLNISVKEAVKALLKSAGKTRLSEDKVAGEIMKAAAAAFAGKNVKPSPAVETLVKTAVARGVRIGVLSSFSEEIAGPLAEKLRSHNAEVSVLSCDSMAKPFPGADAWLKLAKNMRVMPPLCVALVTSAASCKAVLSADMRCIAVPDEFTSFQDFGGADHVADVLDGAIVKDALRLLESDR